MTARESESRNETPHDSMVTKEMYEAGLKYLNRRGTAWCVSDLYKAMSAAKVRDEIGTMVNHEQEPHCCGCWLIRYDKDGLNAVCNECGETRDLISLLANPSETGDMDGDRYRWLKERYYAAEFYYEIDEGKTGPMLIFKMQPPTMGVTPDLDATIDAARANPEMEDNA